MTITAIAGAALVVSINSNLQLTQRTEQRMIAQGMARQLMDEVVGGRYMALGASPLQTAFTPSAWELIPGTRERYDDTDDYDAWMTRPPVDEYGILLGTQDGRGGERHEALWMPPGYFDNWRQEISVSYVDDDDPSVALSGSDTSYHRAITVRIVYDDPQRGPMELAKIRRIVSYVPAVEE